MKRLVVHYLEMVVAMFLGMIAWGLSAAMLFGGEAGSMHGPGSGIAEAGSNLSGTAGTITMLVSMIIPMVGWMRYRGHAWRDGAGMSGAMAVPSILVEAVGTVWPGIFGSMTGIWSHVAMLLGMAVLMVVQRDRYSGHAHVNPSSAPAGARTTPTVTHGH